MLQFTANNNLQTKTAASLLYAVLICTFGKISPEQQLLSCSAPVSLNCGLTGHCSKWSSVPWYGLVQNAERQEIFSTLKHSEQDHLGISYTICSVDSSKVLL